MKEKNYKLEDISVVIVTYNRDKDLAITIESFKKEIIKLREILIIDNNTDDKAKKVIKSIKNNKIKYFKSEVNSLTVSRNLGINKVDKKSKIIIFLDDDVSLEKDYFDKIIEVFNEYPNAVGVSGYYFPENYKINRLENNIRKLALLENWTVNKAKVLSAFGASYPYKLTKIINSEWLSGFNMAYKKEVFGKDKFEEKFFKYALAEDFEFSTRINKKYQRSLFITPYAKLTHRVSEEGRTPKPKLVYMNLVNHLYIQSKNLNDFRGIVSLYFALFNMSILYIAKSLIKPNKTNLLKLKLYFKALYYCLKRINLIRKGNLEIPTSL